MHILLSSVRPTTKLALTWKTRLPPPTLSAPRARSQLHPCYQPHRRGGAEGGQSHGNHMAAYTMHTLPHAWLSSPVQEKQMAALDISVILYCFLSPCNVMSLSQSALPGARLLLASSSRLWITGAERSLTQTLLGFRSQLPTPCCPGKGRGMPHQVHERLSCMSSSRSHSRLKEELGITFLYWYSKWGCTVNMEEDKKY